MTGADVVAEARRWLGTPYRHQAHTRGVGADCGGLIGGVAIALGLLAADWWEREFAPVYGGYGRQPDGTLQALCDATMHSIPAGAYTVGDVLLISFEREPQHLGIVADYVHGGHSIIHAMSRTGRVAEHRLAPEWQRRVVAAYRLRGIA